MPRESIRAAGILYEGCVYEGTRHITIVCDLMCTHGRWVVGERGFVTNTGRFVGRAEAARIAWAAGQTYRELDCLYSEEVVFYTNE